MRELHADAREVPELSLGEAAEHRVAHRRGGQAAGEHPGPGLDAVELADRLHPFGLGDRRLQRDGDEH